jgi:hypothetical protein
VSDAIDIEKRLGALEKDVAHYKRLYLETLERCRKLEVGLLASKSEHLPSSDSQLALSVLGMMLPTRAMRPCCPRQERGSSNGYVYRFSEIDALVERQPCGSASNRVSIQPNACSA